jgi:hypothetical protein
VLRQRGTLRLCMMLRVTVVVLRELTAVSGVSSKAAALVLCIAEATRRAAVEQHGDHEYTQTEWQTKTIALCEYVVCSSGMSHRVCISEIQCGRALQLRLPVG